MIDGSNLQAKCVEEDGYLKSLSSAAAFEKAENEGFDVVLPKANELFIDIDSEEALAAHEEQVDRFETLVRGIVDMRRTPSKSGKRGKYHIVLTLDHDITPLQRIMYQLMLGSDRTREILSYARLELGDPNPTLFFEKKTPSPDTFRTVADIVDDFFGDVP